MSLLTLFLCATAAVLLVLVLHVLGRKAVRDLVELHGTERRARLARSLAGGDVCPLRDAAAGRRRAQEDAIAVLRAGTGGELPTGRAPEALIRQLRSRSAARRGRAVVLLGLLEARDAQRDIATLLHDGDADVRLAAGSTLEALADESSARLLIEALEQGHLPRVQVIERIAHPWAIEAIVGRIDCLSPGGRAALWRAAGLAGAKAALPHLSAALSGGTDEERISAARALGELGAPGALKQLGAALGDPRWEVRAQAANALGKIGGRASAPLLEDAMIDRAWWVRANAANALRRLGSDGTAALSRVRDGSDPYAAELANEVLQGIAV